MEQTNGVNLLLLEGIVLVLYIDVIDVVLRFCMTQPHITIHYTVVNRECNLYL